MFTFGYDFVGIICMFKDETVTWTMRTVWIMKLVKSLYLEVKISFRVMLTLILYNFNTEQPVTLVVCNSSDPHIAYRLEVCCPVL